MGSGISSEPGAGFTDFVCDIKGTVAVHLDYRVCNVKICTGTSGYHYRGDACFLKKASGPLDKGGDGLLVPADHLLHQLVPYHEIRGGGVLIDQEYPASRLPALDYSCRLRGASAGIRRGKSPGVFFIGKVIDKHGNIHVVNAAAVFGTKLEGGVIGDHILPAVAGNVIVDAQFQSL